MFNILVFCLDNFQIYLSQYLELQHPYYENFGFKKGDFPVSEKFHRKAISLPIFPSLKEDQCIKVINVISEALSEDVN